MDKAKTSLESPKQIELSEKVIEITERYEIGTIGVRDNRSRYGEGNIDIDVQVIYNKRIDELGKEPMRESFQFKSVEFPEFFITYSIYGGYVKYTNKSDHSYFWRSSGLFVYN